VKWMILCKEMYLGCNYRTICMARSLSSEANSRSIGQEFPEILWKAKVHNHETGLLIEMNMKNGISWNAMPCCLVKINRRLGRTYWLHLQDIRVKQTSRMLCLLAFATCAPILNTFLRNVGEFLPHDMISHSRTIRH
jgi:hypothetical protein